MTSSTFEFDENMSLFIDRVRLCLFRVPKIEVQTISSDQDKTYESDPIDNVLLANLLLEFLVLFSS